MRLEKGAASKATAHISIILGNCSLACFIVAAIIFAKKYKKLLKWVFKKSGKFSVCFRFDSG